MHIVFIARGIKHSLDRFINELQGKYLPYTMKEKDKEGNVIDRQMLLQMRVCPVQLYDVSFPKEHKDAMLNTLFAGDKGKSINKRNNKFVTVLRKILGLKPIPQTWDEKGKIPLFQENIEMMGVGIKEDYHNEDGQEMI